MGKNSQDVIVEYIDVLLGRVGRKLSAKRLDDVGLLGEEVNLNAEEDLAYTYVMLKADKKQQLLAYNSYFVDAVKDLDDLCVSLGIDKDSYLKIKSDLLNDLDNYLKVNGYGYANASNIDRYGLPDKLSFGRYMVSGTDLVFADNEFGDLYTLTSGALDLQRYKTISVVKSLDLLKELADDIEAVDLPSGGGIEELKVIDGFSAGVLVSVNFNAYDDLLDVFTDLENALDDALGFDTVDDLLGKGVAIEFKQGGI